MVDLVIIPHGQETGDNQVTVLTAWRKCRHGSSTPVEDYRLTRRGAKGVINIKTTDRNGPVVGVKAVRDGDELMMITKNGYVVRIDATGEAERNGLGRRRACGSCGWMKGTSWWAWRGLCRRMRRRAARCRGRREGQDVGPRVVIRSWARRRWRRLLLRVPAG